MTNVYFHIMNYRQTFLQALFIFCEERGLDTGKIAAHSNISIDELNTNPSFPISNEQMDMIWKNIIQISKNELVGLHFGAAMQIAALGVVGQVIQTSNNVKEALQHACMMVGLLTDFYTMSVHEKSETFVITYEKNAGFDKFSTAQNQMGDFLIAFTLYELKGLLIKNLAPLRASFPTYQKDYDREYKHIIKCPLQKSRIYILEFNKEFLNTKIITANYSVQNSLISQVYKLQNPESLSGDFAKKIFNYLITNSYLFTLSIESVACNFNVSVRTLQRKLREERISYIQIVEEVRKTLAIHYITTSPSSVKEISANLGFAEPSSFVRAFKKWLGKTPLEYKNNILVNQDRP